MRGPRSLRLSILCLAAVFLTAVFLINPFAALAQQSSSGPGPPERRAVQRAGTQQPAAVAGMAHAAEFTSWPGLIFAGACAQAAVHKALSPIPWFFLGFFLNAAGYLILLTRAPGDAGQFPAGIPRGLRKVPCTHYSEECVPTAATTTTLPGTSCLGCGGQTIPAFESEAVRWRKQQFIQ